MDGANLILCCLISKAKRRLSYFGIGIFAYIENRLWNTPEPVHKSSEVCDGLAFFLWMLDLARHESIRGLLEYLQACF